MTSKSTYCVYLTFYSGNKLPPFYIGSSSVHRVIEENYHGSVRSKEYSKIYYSELKENPHLFSTEIISTFDTREKAQKYELELHIANDVVNSPWFFNKSLACKHGFNFTGQKHTEETLLKLRKPKSTTINYFKPKSKEHAEKISKNNGMHKEENRNKVRISKLGRKTLVKGDIRKREHPNSEKWIKLLNDGFKPLKEIL